MKDEVSKILLERYRKDKAGYEARRHQSLVRLFDLCDKDKSGDLDVEQLTHIFREMGVKKTDREIRQILREHSSPQHPSLNFQEFENLFSTQHLLDVFHEIDTDQSGFLNRGEIANAMRKIGLRMSDEQVDDLMRKVDIDEDGGAISFEEFRIFFENTPMASLRTIARHWAGTSVVMDVGSDMSVATPTNDLHWWQTIISVSCGGVAARTFTAPLEKLKLVHQTGRGKSEGLLGDFRAIVKAEGWRGLYAGNLTNCLRVFPSAAITCSVYILLSKYTDPHSTETSEPGPGSQSRRSGVTMEGELENIDPHNEPLRHMFCIASGVLTATLATHPLDVIRARLTLSEGTQSGGILRTFRIITKYDNGFRGLYRGLPPTLLAVVPFVAIQSTTIRFMKEGAAENGLEVTPTLLLGVAACAGALAQTSVYPLEVIRRKMQFLDEISFRAAIRKNKAMYSNSLHKLMSILRKTRLSSYYAGILPTFLKIVPSICVATQVMEPINVRFRRWNQEQANLV
ncbi:mitochondrial carrier domain-containing protein [Ochromonadaceae sp. CCMP2298]|nr:mitochondrial carrier domain-containing protein [Ochromonadaceae sp. CCMP2298]|mmetsp:Transcript_28806/g.64649  ORF Transcript_28806/g.64649 Transcript_28806/m.64649 type:complete len:513 (-) Transcript_28806:54-1592(-)